MQARSHPPTCFSPLARGARQACALAIAATLAGCATQHEVRVDSLARPRAAPASYEIQVRDSADAADSLRAQELAGQVRAALGARGMYEAPSNTRPDVIIELECGVGPVEMRPRRVIGAMDRPEPLAPPTRTQAGTDEDGRPIYRERRIVRARDGFYEIVPVYEKYLRVTARANLPPVDRRAPAEIWRIDVSTESESRDLRQALPILVATGIEQLGTDSQGQKMLRIKEADASVASLKHEP